MKFIIEYYTKQCTLTSTYVCYEDNKIYEKNIQTGSWQ